MKHKLIPLLFAAICCYFTACQKLSTIQPQVRLNVPQHYREGISADITYLSASDAITVAEMYSKNGISTKASEAKTIRNIVPIHDKTGKLIMYAVNFSDGYIWVSASKDFYPILAVVEHGTYTLKDTETGLDVIKSDIILEATRQKNDSTLKNIRNQWLFYETYKLEPVIRTKINDEYEDELADLREMAYKNGYKMYPLSDAINNNVPEGIINTLEDKAIDAYAGGAYDESEDYNYNITAYIVEHPYNNHIERGPFVTTHWGQGSPFNSKVANNYHLGCVTIATAQLMKYYRIPIWYNWDSMPDNSSNDILASFLADLHERLKIDTNGNGYVSNAVSYLNSFDGQNFKTRTYTRSDLISTIEKHDISILDGIKKGDKAGHAWICDGLDWSTYGTAYDLYVLNSQAYPRFEYIKNYTYKTESSTVPLFHMNWGWYGSDDGWFHGENWKPGEFDFTYKKHITSK